MRSLPSLDVCPVDRCFVSVEKVEPPEVLSHMCYIHAELQLGWAHASYEAMGRLTEVRLSRIDIDVDVLIILVSLFYSTPDSFAPHRAVFVLQSFRFLPHSREGPQLQSRLREKVEGGSQR